MKEIKENLQNRLKEHRQTAAGNWTGLIIKLALLILLIWLLLNYYKGNMKLPGKFMQKQQNTEQIKETL